MGLIQREIERSDVSTISISLVRGVSEKIKPPRAVYLPWSFGRPLGTPFNINQQRSVLMATFNALTSINRPGEILDLSFHERTEKYGLIVESSLRRLRKSS